MDALQDEPTELRCPSPIQLTDESGKLPKGIAVCQAIAPCVVHAMPLPEVNAAKPTVDLPITSPVLLDNGTWGFDSSAVGLKGEPFKNHEMEGGTVVGSSSRPSTP